MIDHHAEMDSERVTRLHILKCDIPVLVTCTVTCMYM